MDWGIDLEDDGGRQRFVWLPIGAAQSNVNYWVKHTQGCPIVETFIDLPQPCQRFLVISKNLIRQGDDSCDA